MRFSFKFIALLLAISLLNSNAVYASDISPEKPLSAQWVPNAVKITFNSNEGGGGSWIPNLHLWYRA